MFAVIKSGGKQHKVSLGDRLEIEKLDLSVGDEVGLTDPALSSSMVIYALRSSSSKSCGVRSSVDPSMLIIST